MQTVAKDKSFFTGLFTGNKTADQQIKDKYLKPSGDAGFDQAINNYYASLDAARSPNPSSAGSEIDAAWKSAVGKALAGTRHRRQRWTRPSRRRRQPSTRPGRRLRWRGVRSSREGRAAGCSSCRG